MIALAAVVFGILTLLSGWVAWTGALRPCRCAHEERVANQELAVGVGGMVFFGVLFGLCLEGML